MKKSSTTTAKQINQTFETLELAGVVAEVATGAGIPASRVLECLISAFTPDQLTAAAKVGKQAKGVVKKPRINIRMRQENQADNEAIDFGKMTIDYSELAANLVPVLVPMLSQSVERGIREVAAMVIQQELISLFEQSDILAER